MSSLFDDHPSFNNLHTATQALGMAVLGNTIYYLSTAGPGTACKSIWGSLVSSRGRIHAQPWGDDLVGAVNLATLYQGLPNSNFQHMVSLHQGQNFLIAANAKAAALADELDIEQVELRRQLLESCMPVVLSRFAAYLNAHTTVPVLQTWAAELWQAGIVAGGITQLETFGDCLGAWLLTEAYDWLGSVQALLHTGHLHWPVDKIQTPVREIPAKVAEAQPLTMLS